VAKGCRGSSVVSNTVAVLSMKKKEMRKRVNLFTNTSGLNKSRPKNHTSSIAAESPIGLLFFAIILLNPTSLSLTMSLTL
jgi:hypothetical protein